MQRLAPRTAAELSLAAGPATRPTDTPCPPEFQQVSSEAYDACLVYRQQQLAQAQAACTNVTRDSFYDARVRGQLQELATQAGQRPRS